MKRIIICLGMISFFSALSMENTAGVVRANMQHFEQILANPTATQEQKDNAREALKRLEQELSQFEAAQGPQEQACHSRERNSSGR